MAVISQYLLQDLTSYIDEKVVSADYTIGATTRPIGIRRSILTGTTIKKHVYLTTKDPIGMITRVRLMDKDGNVLAQLNDRVEHGKNSGRLFEFVFTIKEG